MVDDLLRHCESRKMIPNGTYFNQQLVGNMDYREVK